MAQTLKFKQVAKDSLFYSRWQYCIAFHLAEVSALKTLDRDYINRVIERRKTYNEISRQRWSAVPIIGKSSSLKTILARKKRDITDEIVENIHSLADTLIDTDIPFKLVTSIDQAWIYSNSKDLITTLSKNTALLEQQYTEAVITRPKNSIKLANPAHTHRSYFKSTKLSDKEKNSLITFFANQSENIRISPAFTSWLLTPYHRSQDYFFMDHNGEGWLVLLALIKPGLVRKTVDIIPT